MLFHTLTIVGVGLIGGSIGLAAKQRGLARRIVGIDRDFDQLDQARRLGAIDDAQLDLLEGVREADLVVFCTPVDQMGGQILNAAPHGKRGAIFTDAGSTKAEIVRRVDAGMPTGARFVGGHPLAGSEKSGVENAQADLFVDRWVVLTPTQQTSTTALDTVGVFWQALGARVRTMSPEDHDSAVAVTSHLPHLVAAALSGILCDKFHDLTAAGFRDTTRVAGGDPDLWTPIFQQNRMAVIAALEMLNERLHEFTDALVSNDTLRINELLAQGKKVRDALGS